MSGNASQVTATADSQIDSISMFRQSLAGRPIAARDASYEQPADAARVSAADALAPLFFLGLRCACDLRPHPTIDVAASPGVRPDATGIDLVMCGSVMGAGGPAEGKGLPFGRADQVTTHVSRDRGVVGGQ